MKKLLEFIDKNPRLPKFVKDNKDLLLKAAAVILVMVLAFAVFVLNESEDETAQIQEKDELEISDSKSIFIDVGGEVKKPTVVELSDGSRVADAIEAAGGITDKADLTDINRAAFVSDGEKIFIPSIIEEETALIGEYGDNNTRQQGAVYSDGKVNINTADSDQLQELNGVGPATAEKIIAYRNENGRFKSTEDIKNVSGIGDKTYEKFKDKIKV
ncbi:MAG: helix-hairpin-helix domain-containing protein [Anaerovoracaceae bacterium]